MTRAGMLARAGASGALDERAGPRLLSMSPKGAPIPETAPGNLTYTTYALLSAPGC